MRQRTASNPTGEFENPSYTGRVYIGTVRGAAASRRCFVGLQRCTRGVVLPGWSSGKHDLISSSRGSRNNPGAPRSRTPFCSREQPGPLPQTNCLIRSLPPPPSYTVFSFLQPLPDPLTSAPPPRPPSASWSSFPPLYHREQPPLVPRLSRAPSGHSPLRRTPYCHTARRATSPTTSRTSRRTCPSFFPAMRDFEAQNTTTGEDDARRRRLRGCFHVPG